jgi:hypothetical protein
MQPLVELLFGTRALSGSSGRANGYQKYGRDRSGDIKSDMELSSPGGNRVRKDGAGWEDMDTLRTLDTKDSQETILRQGQVQTNEATRGLHKGGIVRTDIFAVSYETDSDSQKAL